MDKNKHWALINDVYKHTGQCQNLLYKNICTYFSSNYCLYEIKK